MRGLAAHAQVFISRDVPHHLRDAGEENGLHEMREREGDARTRRFRPCCTDPEPPIETSKY